MKSLIILPFLFFSILLYPQTKIDKTELATTNKIEEKTSSDIQNLVAEIDYMKDKLDFQQKLSEQTMNSVSVQLDAASINLTIFGILFGIAAIGIGIYVTRIERKIVKISEKNEELLGKSQKIKEDVDAVNKLIQSDIHRLYIQIKREETDYILNRLIKVPIEIKEVGFTLLSRELLPDDFQRLRQAYLNSNKSHPDNYMYFVRIFIRHFLEQTLRDNELRKKCSYYITSIFYNALDNEMIKCTIDLATVAVDESVQEFKAELNSFFLGLTNSKHVKGQDVIKVLFDNLKTRKNRFDTFNVVEPGEKYRFAKIAFGNLLHENYSNDNPTESELLVFKELEKLQIEQQTDDELERHVELDRKKQ